MREGAPDVRPNCFPPSMRVKARADFVSLTEHGQRVHTPHFVLLVGPSASGCRRVGVTVTKRVAHAVGRNRVKRLVREVCRQHPDLLPESADVVFVARKGAPEAEFDDVLAEVRRAASALRRAAARVGRKAQPPC